MLDRQDCILLLTELQEKGVDVKQQLNEVFTPSKMPEVIKFIQKNSSIDMIAFYDKLRKSYNKKKSDLYINIMKEVDEPKKVLTTLASLQLQILLFASKLEDPQVFLHSSRSEEISMVLNNYFRTYNITQCQQLIQLIKADIKLSEWAEGRNI